MICAISAVPSCALGLTEVGVVLHRGGHALRLAHRLVLMLGHQSAVFLINEASREVLLKVVKVAYFIVVHIDTQPLLSCSMLFAP